MIFLFSFISNFFGSEVLGLTINDFLHKPSSTQLHEEKKATTPKICSSSEEEFQYSDDELLPDSSEDLVRITYIFHVLRKSS